MKQYSKFKLTRYHKTNKTLDNNKITISVTTVIFTPSRFMTEWKYVIPFLTSIYDVFFLNKLKS